MPSVLTTADLELGCQPLRTFALLFLSLGSNLQMPRITGPRVQNPLITDLKNYNLFANTGLAKHQLEHLEASGRLLPIRRSAFQGSGLKTAKQTILGTSVRFWVDHVLSELVYQVRTTDDVRAPHILESGN